VTDPFTLDPAIREALISGGGTALVTLAGLITQLLRRQTKALAEVREHALEAREQVSNTHETNLRDDLDKVIGGLDQLLDGQARHEEALHDLRLEVAHERTERLAVADRLDTHMAATDY